MYFICSVFTYCYCPCPFYLNYLSQYLIVIQNLQCQKRITCSPRVSVSLQWINSRTLVLVDSHEKLQVVDRPSQDILETLDLEQVQLVYNSRHFKSLATGGNVSQALVRD